jgi:two-component system response regulator HydG
VAITDLRMEGVDGFDVLEGLQRLDPTVPVLIMTAFGAIETAIEAIKRGAYHYFPKPFQLGEVLVFVERALAERRLREENRSLRRLAMDRCRLDAMVGQSRVMQALYDLVERVAQSAAPALIRGESGTGKELVARALHFTGPRRERSFVGVNCSALPATLLESELFGHVRGAFTGASSPRRGLFLEADGGTLLLDEIGDMPTELQARLLRVIEDGEVRAVGSDATRKVDVRIVAATHQPLEDRVREGQFRADLFYRINVVPIVVPPLRERVEDIPLLVEHLLAKAREKNPATRVSRFSPELIAELGRRPWPGNVRELENIVERLVIVCAREVADLEDLEDQLDAKRGDFLPGLQTRSGVLPLKQLEDEYIAWVIGRCGGNKTRAADLLGIDVSTIHRRERSSR